MNITDKLARALYGLLNQAVVDTADPEDINPKAVERARRAVEAYERIPMDCTMPYVMETVYRVILYYHIDTTVEQEEAWFTRAFRIARAKSYKNVELITTDGGPAHTGYITIEGVNRNAVMALADRLVKAARILKIKLDR